MSPAAQMSLEQMKEEIDEERKPWDPDDSPKHG